MLVKPNKTWYEIHIRKPMPWKFDRWVPYEFGIGDFTHKATFDSEREAFDYIRRAFVEPQQFVIKELEI